MKSILGYTRPSSGFLLFFLMTILPTVAYASEGLQITSNQWQEDLVFMVNKLKSTHPDLYHAIDKNTFDQRVNTLNNRIPQLTQAEIITGFSTLVASLRDGHTYINPAVNKALNLTFPLSIQLFTDGVFVTGASSLNRHLLGVEITAIAGKPIAKVIDDVAAAVAYDNEFSRADRLPSLLLFAVIMQGMGYSVDGVSLLITTKDQNGQLSNTTLKAEKPDQRSLLVNHFDADSDNLPLHMKHRKTPYWYEFLDEHKTVYMQLNTVSNSGQKSFRQFYLAMFADLQERDVTRFILDIRYNGGGNGDLLWPFIYQFIKRERYNQPGQLFTITSGKTFSAAVMATARMKKHTNTLLVGEPPGGPFNHYGDARRFQLPNSKLGLAVSSLYWQEGHPADSSHYAKIDIPAPFSSQQYFVGTDPALDKILQQDTYLSLLQIAKQADGKEALAIFEQRKAHFGQYSWWQRGDRRAINREGYRLLGQNKFAEAITVFHMNTTLFPQSANAWDSLAEGNFKNKNFKMARQYYMKTLQLNDDNANAKKVLAELDELGL